MTKESLMDTDALKAAMAGLGDQDGVPAIPSTVAVFKASGSVDTLGRWQIIQIGVGIGIAIAGGSAWGDLLARPGLLFASGLLINLLGAAMIGFGIAGLIHARRIDLSAPIVEAEGHMARLYRVKLMSSWTIGFGWCVLWLPFMAVVVWLLWGVDVLGAIGINAWLLATFASAIAGWGAMWGLRRWATRTGRTRFAAWMDDMMTGDGVREARRRLEDVARFTAGQQC